MVGKPVGDTEGLLHAIHGGNPLVTGDLDILAGAIQRDRLTALPGLEEGTAHARTVQTVAGCILEISIKGIVDDQALRTEFGRRDQLAGIGRQEDVVDVDYARSTTIDAEGKRVHAATGRGRQCGQVDVPLVPADALQIRRIAVIDDLGVVDLHVETTTAVGQAAME